MQKACFEMDIIDATNVKRNSFEVQGVYTINKSG